MSSVLLPFALAATLLHSAASHPEAEERRRVCMSPAETRENVAAHKLRDPMALLREAAHQTRAEPLGTRLCRWNERFVYEMSLLRRDGKVLRVFLDASSGESLTARDK
jgi:uncharacterized membrane protein YkoI